MRNKIDALLSPLFEPKDPQPQLAIEISAYSIKLLEIARSSSGVFKVLSIGEEFLPWGHVSSSGISDIASVSSVLNILLKKLKPRTKLVATSVSDGFVSTRDVLMPNNVSAKDREDLLLSEVATQVGASPEELLIDYCQIPSSSKHDDKFHVVSCRKDTAEEYLSIFEGLSIKPFVMDTDANALFYTARRSAQSLGLSEREGLCVIDCGASHSAMYVYKNEEKVYAKHFTFGGYALTQEVQVEFNMEYRDAEIAKVSNKLAPKYADELLPRFIEQLIVNIERALDSYGDSASLRALLLVGGVASSPTLQEKLELRFHKKVHVINPLKGFDLGNNIMSGINMPAFSVVTGLLLRGLDNND